MAAMPAHLHIACASDEVYAPYCAAMLHSLFESNAGSPITIHFLHPPELASTLLDRFRRLAECHGIAIRFHAIADDAVKGLPALLGVQRPIWYRVFLPELLPEIERILYIDADTLVTDRLDPLWQTDLNGYHLAAVRNVTEPRLMGHLNELGLPDDAKYFNSGVLLMNLPAWRRDQSAKRIVELARAEGSRLFWPNQDAMNMVFPSECRLLHPRWNCMNSLYFWKPWANDVFGSQAVEEATLRPGILHFEGPTICKPWHYLCQHPYRDRYRRHLHATRFPVPPADGFTLKNAIRKYIQHARTFIADLHG